MSYDSPGMTQKVRPLISNIRDFAFFCVRTNETSASSQFAQLFSLAKTLQRSGT